MTARADSPAPLRDYLVKSANGVYTFAMKVPRREPPVKMQLDRARTAKAHSERRRQRYLTKRDTTTDPVQRARIEKYLDYFERRVQRAEQSVERLEHKMAAEAAPATKPRVVHHPQTGLYLSDDPHNAIWTVDWFADAIEIANDGVHLVRHGPWASSLGDLAVAFYERNELLAEYPISTFVTDEATLVHSVSHFFWPHSSEMDNERLVYVIVTEDRTRFEFDMRSGALDSRTAPPPPKLFPVKVTVSDGSELFFSDFASCDGDFHALHKLQGTTNAATLHGFRRDDDNAQLLTIIAVPFAALRTANAVPADDANETLWHVVPRDRDEFDMLARSDDIYCGQTATRKTRKLRAGDLRRIEFDVP